MRAPPMLDTLAPDALQYLSFFLPTPVQSDLESEDADMRKHVPRIADLLEQMQSAP